MPNLVEDWPALLARYRADDATDAEMLAPINDPLFRVWLLELIRHPARKGERA